MVNDVELAVQLAMEAKDYAGTLKDVEKQTQGWAGKMSGILEGIATGGINAIGAGVVAVGAGTAKIISDSVDMASQMRQANNDIRAELGLTEEETKRLGDIGVQVFKDNFFDSIEESTSAVINARKQLGNLNDEELTDAAENAARLNDVFDVDINESLNAAKVLTDKFGLSQEQAFDLITSGFQKGLNSSDDFLESITEYGNLFAENGASADEFFSVLETGLQSGVLGSDKAADLFKEFGIRIRESGEFSGNIVDDFQRLTAELSAIEDPIERNARGVELFGTMWEDLGESAVLAIDPMATGLEEMAGTTDELNAKYENFGAMFEGIKRSALIAIAPIGEALLKIAEDAMPKLQEIMTQAEPVIAEFAAQFGENLGPALDAILANMRGIADAMGLTTENMTDGEAVAKLLGETLTGFITVLETLTGWLESTVTFWGKWGGAIETLLNPFGKLLSQVGELDQKLQDLAGTLPDWLTPGSPTPLELGIKGIGEAVKNMPPLDFAATANIGNIATAGAGVGGGGAQFGDIIIGGDGNIDIDETVRQFAQILRSKLGVQ